MLHELRTGKTVHRLPGVVQSRPWVYFVWLTIAVGVAYFLAAQLSLALLTQPDGVAVFWPAAGISAGVLIRLGPSARIPVVAGTMVATIVANLLGDRNLWSAIVFAACNAGEAVLVAALIDRLFTSPFNLDSLQRVIGLFVVALIGTGVSGIGGSLGFVWFHSSTASVSAIWWHWFTSDAMGIISVAPFLIALPSMGAGSVPRKEFLEGVLALVILSALNLLVIRLPNEPWTAASAIAALLPLLLWIAARCGPVVAAAATFICTLTIVWTTTFGVGIFGDPTVPMTERVLSAQASIVAVSLCALVLASLFAERREQAAALVESEARLQSALRAGGVAAFDWQVNSGLSRRSYNSAQVLGYDPEGTLSSTSFIERIHPEDCPHFKACLYGVSRDDPSYVITFRYLHPNGQEIWLEENGQAEFDPGGRIVRVRGLTRDITAHKRAEADLSAARKQAELANRAKSSFLSAASHELRQPLQNLTLLQSALRQRIRNGDARTLIVRIGHSLGVMKGILDGLLDVNRLESGNIVPSMSDFHVNDIFDSVTGDFRELIKGRYLELRTVGSSARIHSDKHLLEVMIRNLLSNAVRYTEQGKILVGCRRSGDKLRIEVWDSGVGIAAADLPRIFQEYYQVEDHAHSEGYGLGLAIVQRLGKTLNHPVNVRSTPGKGSCFSVELAMAPTKADKVDRPEVPIDNASAPLSGAILVIEDDSLIREGLEDLLNSRGLDVVSAADGNDAVALITRKNIRPDLILSDYNLPGSMDGLESISAVRAALASEIPAIVLTGDIRSQGLAAVTKRGIEIAIKPLDVDTLLQLIARLISTSGNGRSAKNLSNGQSA